MYVYEEEEEEENFEHEHEHEYEKEAKTMGGTMKEKPAPHRGYILVCTHDECADGGSEKLLKRLKRCVEEKGIKKDIRVMACGCLGKCDEGPNVLLEPGHVWCSDTGKGDVESLVAAAQGLAGRGKRDDDA